MTTLDVDGALQRLAELSAPVARALDGQEGRAWLVGGVVRDALLERELPDLDLVVDTDAGEAARRIARAVQGTPVPLGEQFGCWRVARHDESHIDVCALRGSSLDADLRLRDFTCNAMAVPLHEPSRLEDPLDGQADLVAGLVRMTSERALDEDPLRLLRGARFAHVLGMDVESATAKAIRTRAASVAQPSGERVFAELCALVQADEARRGLRLLDELHLVAALLPELEACKGLEQSRYHHLDVYEHTLAVLDNCEDIAGQADHYLPAPPGVPVPDPALDGEQQLVLRFAALCHDIGKPATRTARSGRVSFIGHDEAGQQLVDAMCDRWAVSNRFRDGVKLLVRTHLALGMLLHEPIDARTRYRYLRRVEPRGAEAIVLSLADRFATAGPDDRRKWVRRHHQAARELWADHWREQHAGRPARLLDGQELAEIAGVEPGPRLGELVAALAEAQAVGEVTSRDEALEWARRW